MGISRVSTHLLDTVTGRPAAGVSVVLDRMSTGADGAPEGPAVLVGNGVTDVDGRVAQLNAAVLEPGEYRLTFSTAEYFVAAHGRVFYPRITVHVVLTGGRAHFHIPVLASTYSYSTYLGS